MPHRSLTHRQLENIRLGNRTQHGEQIRNKRVDRRIYHTARWKRFRKMILDGEPLCRRCKAAGKIVLASEIHHIKRLVLFRGDAYVPENVEPLCKPCHSKHTAATTRP